MRYLQPAFYGEGPSDYAFLPRLLLRLCEQVLLDLGCGPFEVADPEMLNDAECAPRRRSERVAEAAFKARDAWNLLWVHSDGAGDPDAARATSVQPAFDLLAQRLPPGSWAGVAVIPVREVEAWVLADGDALRAALGVSLDDVALGLPGASACEGLADPKPPMEQAFKTALGRQYRPGRGSGLQDILRAVAERSRCETLRSLPSFRACEAEMRSALLQLYPDLASRR
nr:DUF4276 family protein [Deltaproteobacteria bacterium]